MTNEINLFFLITFPKIVDLLDEVSASSESDSGATASTLVLSNLGPDGIATAQAEGSGSGKSEASAGRRRESGRKYWLCLQNFTLSCKFRQISLKESKRNIALILKNIFSVFPGIYKKSKGDSITNMSIMTARILKNFGEGERGEIRKSEIEIELTILFAITNKNVSYDV